MRSLSDGTEFLKEVVKEFPGLQEVCRAHGREIWEGWCGEGNERLLGNSPSRRQANRGFRILRSSPRGKEASLISQGQVEGLTTRRWSRAQPTSQDCTKEHMGAIIHAKENDHELHSALKELLLPFTHPFPLYETLVLPTALEVLHSQSTYLNIFFTNYKNKTIYIFLKENFLKTGSRIHIGNS